MKNTKKERRSKKKWKTHFKEMKWNENIKKKKPLIMKNTKTKRSKKKWKTHLKKKK
jgi:hypothetical protein